MDQAAYHEQELLIQRDLERVIEKAKHEPITGDEASLLAWASGVQTKQEIQHGNHGNS